MRPNAASRTLSRLSLLLGALCLQCALASQCFYPDGSPVVAETVNQCSSSGGVCCPENWECLSNGLCFNKAANFLGRYSCTDSSWGSSCPNFCLDNGSGGGDQAVLQCNDGSYCCDANRVSFNCCDNGAERFNLADDGTGVVTSMTSSGPSSSAQPSSSPSPSPTSSSPPASSSPPPSSDPSSSATTEENTATSQSSTSVVTSSTTSSVVSQSGKPESTVQITTIFTTAIATPAPSAAHADSPTSSSQPSSSHSSKTAMTLGLAIGVPLGLALLLVPLLFFLFRRRRKYTLVARERRRAEVADAYAPADKDSRPGTPLTPEYANGAHYYSAKHVRAPSEIDGGTLGLHRHQSEVAELSAEPRTPGIPEDSSGSASSATVGATGWQPPPRSEPKLVGGRAYSHRTPGNNPDYQPYLSELPT